MCRNTANNINFYLRSISVKIKDQITSKLEKKNSFWPILGLFFQFWVQKKVFQENLALLQGIHKGFTRDSTMPKFQEKTQFQENTSTDGSMEGQGQADRHPIL